MPNFLKLLLDPLTDLPSRGARALSPVIDPIQGDQRGDRGYVRPFMQGALEGTGDLMSDMTSPASLLMALASGSPTLGRMLRIGKMNRALGTSDNAIRGLGAETAAWNPKGGTAGLQPLRIEERMKYGYDIPDNPRAQELERVRKVIEEAYLAGAR
jgi:hypothetical protein